MIIIQNVIVMWIIIEFQSKSSIINPINKQTFIFNEIQKQKDIIWWLYMRQLLSNIMVLNISEVFVSYLYQPPHSLHPKQKEYLRHFVTAFSLLLLPIRWYSKIVFLIDRFLKDQEKRLETPLDKIRKWHSTS